MVMPLDDGDVTGLDDETKEWKTGNPIKMFCTYLSEIILRRCIRCCKCIILFI